MALYFFDICDRQGFRRDEVGDEIDSLDEAREQCQALLSDIVHQQPPNGELHVISCDVRDAPDRVVYRGQLTYRGTRFTA